MKNTLYLDLEETVIKEFSTNPVFLNNNINIIKKS